MRRLFNMGPGLLVTAAFIGPGTVTTATLAGAHFGLALLWAVVFSTLATIVLQEWSARLGLVARMGPAEALGVAIQTSSLRVVALGLVVLAIGFGNAAFQTGNITGAALGLHGATGVSMPVCCVGIAAAAAAMLASGTYKRIERSLIVIVVVMSCAFIGTAVASKPALVPIWEGLWPRIPVGAELTIIGLIGTTVVPYNLFLHASSVQAKWSAERPVSESLAEARTDATVAITVGGLITASIILTAGTFFVRGASIGSATVMAEQLGPLLGPWASYTFLVGLMAAGLTSAITAPLAAAYATAGAMGWPADLRSWRFRLVWLTVLVVGTVFAATGRRPIHAIQFAQAFNGLLLPMLAGFLMYVMNQRRVLGDRVNGPAANCLGGGVLLVTVALGLMWLARSIGVLQ